MTLRAKNGVYPHVFLDANALPRLARSLSHHLTDPQHRKSYIRLALEMGITRFATAASLYRFIQHRIMEDESLRGGIPAEKLLDALDEAVEKEWLILLNDMMVEWLDSVQRIVYEELVKRWPPLLERVDPEDATMLRYAALNYALHCVIRTRSGYHTPSYMLLVSDDPDLTGSQTRRLLDLKLKEALQVVEKEGYALGRYPRKSRLISVAKWDGLRQYVRKLLS